VRNDPVILACDYPLTVPTLLFGSASGTTPSSSGTTATTLLNRLSTVFSGGGVAHEAQLVPEPINRVSSRPRPPPSTTPTGAR
jgi:hypothetical protein